MLDQVDQDALIVAHMPVARHLATKYLRKLPKHMEADDVISAAYIGLVQAAHAFDPARGFKFTTFAKRRIIGAIIDDLRHDAGRKQYRGKGIQIVQWPDPIADGIVSYDRPDPGLGPDHGCYVADNLAAVDRALLNIEHRRAHFFRERVFGFRSMVDIAKELGCGESRGAQLYRNAANHVRRELRLIGTI